MMRLTQLQYFKCICKHLNITHAAEELHISQPAITKSIKELEAELGVTLLVRGNKSVTLTKEGQLFLNKASEILSQVDSLTLEMYDLGEIRRKMVKVGIPPAIGTLFLPELNIIVKEHLGLDLEVVEASSEDCIASIANDEMDLAIVLLMNEYYPNIDSYTLKDTELKLCINKAHPLSSRTSVDIEELADEPVILFYPGKLLMDIFQKSSITPKFVLSSNQLQTITKYINANLAITLQFPEVFYGNASICTIPLKNKIPMKLALIRKKGRYHSVYARSIFDFLVENAHLLPGI